MSCQPEATRIVPSGSRTASTVPLAADSPSQRRCSRATSISARRVRTRVPLHAPPATSAPGGLVRSIRYRTLVLGGVSPRRSRRALVDERPEHAEALDGLDEALEVHRLDHVGVHAEVVAGDEVLLLARRGEDDDRQALERRVAADLAQHLEPVLARHLDVEQHDRRVAGLAVGEGAVAAQVRPSPPRRRWATVDPVGEVVLRRAPRA